MKRRADHIRSRHRRASAVRAGDRVRCFDLELTVTQVHEFPAMILGPNVSTPACILFFFDVTEHTLSVEPHEKIRLAR